MVETAAQRDAQPDPEPDPQLLPDSPSAMEPTPSAGAVGTAGRLRWRSGLGCGFALLSVLVLVMVGEYSGLLLQHGGSSGTATGRSLPSVSPSSSSDLRSLLSRLPDTTQSVPETADGVSQLLAELHIPSGTPTQTEIAHGDILVALGRTGDCVFLEVHDNRLSAWLPNQGAACTTGEASAEVHSHG